MYSNAEIILQPSMYGGQGQGQGQGPPQAPPYAGPPPHMRGPPHANNSHVIGEELNSSFLTYLLPIRVLYLT